jgi:magnesium-transporting ATPase (P-type)
MHQLDFQVDMLTGDHWEVAKEVTHTHSLSPADLLTSSLLLPLFSLQICDTVSIPTANCHARLLPQEKLSWIHKTQIGCDDKLNSQGGVVMLGDGINGSLFSRLTYLSPLASLPSPPFLTSVPSVSPLSFSQMRLP